MRIKTAGRWFAVRKSKYRLFLRVEEEPAREFSVIVDYFDNIIWIRHDVSPSLRKLFISLARKQISNRLEGVTL